MTARSVGLERGPTLAGPTARIDPPLTNPPHPPLSYSSYEPIGAAGASVAAPSTEIYQR